MMRSSVMPLTTPDWWTRTLTRLRALVKRGPDEDVEEPVDAIDEAGDESFPASDPPPWTLGVEPHVPPNVDPNVQPHPGR